MSDCRCGRPTRNDAYYCDDCADTLTHALGEIPWLDTELQTTTARQQGIDYRRLGGGKGAQTAPRVDIRINGDQTPDPTTMDAPALGVAIQNDPANMVAADARAELKAILVAWALFCATEKVRHSSPDDGLPADNIPAISRWLMWRVDGLALHEIGPEAITEITAAVNKCRRAVDTPPDKWFAGPCSQTLEDNECGADLYARSMQGDVRCYVCGATYDVEARRRWLLDAAEDRLADATTLARSVSWLGAAPLTASRVRLWAHRGRLATKGHTADGRPLYRIGDAIDLLASAS